MLAGSWWAATLRGDGDVVLCIPHVDPAPGVNTATGIAGLESLTRRSESGATSVTSPGGLPDKYGLAGGGALHLLLSNPPWPTEQRVRIQSSGGLLTADDFVLAESAALAAVRIYYATADWVSDPWDSGSDFFLRIWADDGTGTQPGGEPLFVSGPHNALDGVLSIDTFEKDPFGPDVVLGATFHFDREFFVAEAGVKYWVGMTADPPPDELCLGVATSHQPASSFEPMVQSKGGGWIPVILDGEPPVSSDMGMDLFAPAESGGTTVLTLSGLTTNCTVRITPTTAPISDCQTGGCNSDSLYGPNCYAEANLGPGQSPVAMATALAMGFANGPGVCNESVITATAAGPRVVITTYEGTKPKLCLSVNGIPIGIIGGPENCEENGCGMAFRVGPGPCDFPAVAAGVDHFVTPPGDCALDPNADDGTWARITLPGSVFDMPGLPPAEGIDRRIRLTGVARDFAEDDSDTAIVRLENFRFDGCSGDFSRPGAPAQTFAPDGVADEIDLAAFAPCYGTSEPFPNDCGFFDYDGNDVVNVDDLNVLQCLVASGNSVECCPCNVDLPQATDAAVPTAFTRRHLRGCAYVEVARDALPWPEKWIVDYELSNHEPSAGTHETGVCEEGDSEGANGNNVIANANNLGLLSEGAPRQVYGVMGNLNGLCDLAPFWPGDHDADVYRFTLAFTANVRLRADALTGVDCPCSFGQDGIVSLWLYDDRGNLATYSDLGGASDPALNVTLGPGAHYLLVAAAGQVAPPLPNGSPGIPNCSVIQAPEVDDGATDPTGCYDLHLAVLPCSEMRITQETGAGGSFTARSLVQPLIALEKVCDPVHSVLIDTGDLGEDAVILAATGHYVTELDAELGIVPGDIAFVPGVRDDGGVQVIEPIQYTDPALDLAAHRITPPQPRPCEPLPPAGGADVSVPSDAGVGSWRLGPDNSKIICGDSADCAAGASIASGVGYRFDSAAFTVNGFQSVQGDPTFDGLHWRNVTAAWKALDEVDGNDAPQSELYNLFAELGGITQQEIHCLTENVPGNKTIAAVFAGGASFGGGTAGEIDRLCNGAVIEHVDPNVALHQIATVKGVCWTDGSATFVTAVAPGEPVHLVCGGGQAGETQPCCGYIDPRQPSSNGVDLNLGLVAAWLRFSDDVFKCDGSDIDTSAFKIVETGDGDPPNLTGATYLGSDRSYVVVKWDRPITLQEWTTIIAVNVCDAEGTPIASDGDLGPGVNEPDRVDYGFLPGNVNQNNCVEPFDLLSFRCLVNGLCEPECGYPLDYIDIDPNLIIDPFDLLAFRQLINGVGPGGPPPWAGECMNHPRP